MDNLLEKWTHGGTCMNYYFLINLMVETHNAELFLL